MEPHAYLLEKSDNGTHFIVLDPTLSEELLAAGHKRLIASIGTVSFHCALLPMKGRGHFVYVAAAVRKQLGLTAGDYIGIKFSPDDTPYQFDMPEEFREVLDTDPSAQEVFEGLTDGNKRGLIHLVTLVKSPDKRIERALKIANQLKRGVTSPRLVLK